MKKLLLIFLPFALVMCNAVEPDPAQTEITDKPQEQPAMIKVMSSNIRSGQDDANYSYMQWSYRKNAYLAMLSETQPDIIGMQEAKSSKVKDLVFLSEYEIVRFPEYDGSVPTVTDDQLPLNLIMFKTKTFRRLDSGVFYYNANDPSKPVHYPYDATGWQVRGAVWAKLEVRATGKIVYVYDTHFTHDPEVFDEVGNKIFNIEPRRKASQQLVQTIQEMAKDENAAVFVIGDLNCCLKDSAGSRNGPRSLEPLTEYMWSAREDAEITDGNISYNGFNHPDVNGNEVYNKAAGNIDHIFYRGAQALEFKTVNSPDYGVRFISDHFPITCTFKL